MVALLRLIVMSDVMLLSCVAVVGVVCVRVCVPFCCVLVVCGVRCVVIVQWVVFRVWIVGVCVCCVVGVLCMV